MPQIFSAKIEGHFVMGGIFMLSGNFGGFLFWVYGIVCLKRSATMITTVQLCPYAVFVSISAKKPAYARFLIDQGKGYAALGISSFPWRDLTSLGTKNSGG